ncbi:hypothetical protein FOZ63_017270, partial [Perkinsus olseni]
KRVSGEVRGVVECVERSCDVEGVVMPANCTNVSLVLFPNLSNYVSSMSIEPADDARGSDHQEKGSRSTCSKDRDTIVHEELFGDTFKGRSAPVLLEEERIARAIMGVHLEQGLRGKKEVVRVRLRVEGLRTIRVRVVLLTRRRVDDVPNAGNVHEEDVRVLGEAGRDPLTLAQEVITPSLEDVEKMVRMVVPRVVVVKVVVE